MTAERPGRAWIRPLRLWCGLILFTYLLTHFTNHALGLVSLDAMAVGRVWFLSLWRNPVGTSALYGALLTHWLLGLWLLYKRRALRAAAPRVSLRGHAPGVLDVRGRGRVSARGALFLGDKPVDRLPPVVAAC